MSDIIRDTRGDLVGLLHGRGVGVAAPKPFERDIFLFDTHVAGTSYIAGIEELEPYLQVGEKLEFIRESDNPHDDSAIAIRTLAGTKIGYVPKSDNVIFSRLMDAGKLLFARIVSKDTIGRWLKIDIQVFLHE